MADGEVTPLRPGGAAPPPSGSPGGGAPPGTAAGGVPPPPAGPPTGISPAMQDTGRQGQEMQARIAVAALASQLGMFASMLGLHTELGKTIHEAARILGKAVPPGSIPEGALTAQQQKLAQMMRQNATNVGAMRQMAGGAGAGAGGVPGMPPAAAPRPPQMPGMAMAA